MDKREDIEAAAEQLRGLLAAVEDEQLVASAGIVRRLEGAVVALEVLAGTSSVR